MAHLQPQFKKTIDANARFPNRPVILQKQITYGQLQRIVEITVAHNVAHNQSSCASSPNHHVIAVVKLCRLKIQEEQGLLPLISTDGTFGRTVVVDAKDIVAVAARVLDRGEAFFVEQPGTMDFFTDTTQQVEEVVP